MTPLDILKAARARIEDPRRWTSEAFARSSDSSTLLPADPTAVCWCSWGAVIVESGTDATARVDAVNALHTAARSLGATSASAQNDRGHEHALAMFDRAIAALEAT